MALQTMGTRACRGAHANLNRSMKFETPSFDDEQKPGALFQGIYEEAERLAEELSQPGEDSKLGWRWSALTLQAIAVIDTPTNRMPWEITAPDQELHPLSTCSNGQREMWDFADYDQRSTVLLPDTQACIAVNEVSGCCSPRASASLVSSVLANDSCQRQRQQQQVKELQIGRASCRERV